MNIKDIPKGAYCYTILKTPSIDTDWRMIVKNCPYWGAEMNQQNQDNGFCTYLHLYDWIDGTLLWDQIKECGINEEK